MKDYFGDKIEVGDVCMVVGNTCCHGFEINSLIIAIDDKDHKFKGGYEYLAFWWVKEKDVVRIGRL